MVDQPLSSDNVGNNLTLRMILAGREVGVIIGKAGETINTIRQTSGARIHISDGSCPERVITAVGAPEAVCEAYSLMCERLEAGEEGGKRERRDTLSLRLVVPASQCGSLIGKGGAKIKEIRELTGANVNVGSDLLPGSTERCVSLNGSKDAVTQCVYQVCTVMSETPLKGTTVQYQPGRMPFGPGMMGGGGGMDSGPRRRSDGRHGGPPGVGGMMGGGPGMMGGPAAVGMMGGGGGSSHALAALASLASSQIRRGDRDREKEVTHQMGVANELIGSIIGKGGSKIAEIRQMSGANIQISKSADKEPTAERQIQITGSPDSVALAKSLINMSLDLHKVQMEREEEEEDMERGGRRDDRRFRNTRNDYNNYGGGMGGMGMPGMAGGIPGVGVLANREVMQALETLTHFNNMTNGSLFGAPGFGQMGGGMSRGRNGAGMGVGGGGGGRGREEERKPTTRNKFSPY